MADIDISHNHSLGKEAAKAKSNEVIEKIRSEFGVQGSWDGDVFRITKPTTGSFTVTDNNVRVQVELGFAMRMIKGKIEDRIKSELRRALG